MRSVFQARVVCGQNWIVMLAVCVLLSGCSGSGGNAKGANEPVPASSATANQLAPTSSGAPVTAP